jgi:SAM-dependent methyltransferase
MSNRTGTNQAERTASDEGWRPIPCTQVTPLRRFFDLQSGTIWRDLVAEIGTVDGTLVDVGCGAQPYRALLPSGASYVGIDTAQAGELFGYHSPDTRYYDGEHWPLAEASADVVLATETLEHVLDPAQFLREAERCLRPGGRLVLTVPFAARWHFIPADYWRFTPSGLKHLLTAAGFADVDVRARGNALTVAAYKSMALFTKFMFPQRTSAPRALLYRAVGLLTAPLFVAWALVGNLSLAWGGGDDCLGYTVTARKPAPGA